jgi:hypothetical protein
MINTVGIDERRDARCWKTGPKSLKQKKKILRTKLNYLLGIFKYFPSKRWVVYY